MDSRKAITLAALLMAPFATPAWPQPAGDLHAARRDACGDPLPPFAVMRLGTTRWGQGAATNLQYSRDGKVLAAGVHHDGVYTWDADTGKRLARVPMDADERMPIIAFSGDLGIVATGLDREAAGRIQLREVASGKQLGVILTDWGHAMALSPDGKFLATVHQQNSPPDVQYVTRIWDTTRAVELRKHSGRSVAFATDSKTVFVGDGKGVHAFDLFTGNEVRCIDGDGRLVAVAADGKTLATHGEDAIRIHDAASGKESGRISILCQRGEIRPGDLALSHDGRTVALACSQFLAAWDTATAKERFRENGDFAFATIAFRPGTQVLSWGSGESRIRHWDICADKEILPWPGFRQVLNPLAFTPDGKSLVSAGNSGTVQFLNLDNGCERLVRPPSAADDVRAQYGEVAYSRDGKLLTIADGVQQLYLLDAGTGKLLRTMTGGAYFRRPQFSPDGKLVAAVSRAEGGRLFTWDTATGKLLRTIDGITGQFGECCMAFSWDSKMIAAGGAGIRLWDVATGKPIRRLRMDGGANLLAFAPDGRTLAAGWGDVIVFDVESREEIYSLRATGNNYALAISPDGRVLATASDDTIVRLWDLPTGTELARLIGHSHNVNRLVFSPDGKRLASSSADTTVLIWDVPAALKAGPPTMPIHVPYHPDKLWATLAAADAGAAHKAIWQMVDNPDGALAWLQKHLKATGDKDTTQDAVVVPAGELLRALRALEVLERIGTPAARKLMQALASADSPRIANAARTAMARLDKREGNP